MQYWHACVRTYVPMYACACGHKCKSMGIGFVVCICTDPLPKTHGDPDPMQLAQKTKELGAECYEVKAL